jgi:hypothetical protein
LGSHHVDIIIGSRYVSARRPITVIANGFDTDGDDISDAVEDENNGIGGPITTISYQGNNYYYNRNSADSPPLISTSTPWGDSLYVNRGTHDYSLARGTVSNGRLSNGLRIANSGTGYQYYRGGDPADTDNWAILELINFVERVAREWNRRYPGYPIITSMDMSRQPGGPFPPHDQHQNGLEVDVRYIRTDNSSGGVLVTDPSYSRTRTQQLVDLFLGLATGAGVTILSADNQLQGVQFDADHTDHMHIWIVDPDGSN